MCEPPSLTDLHARAVDGEHAAWRAIVDRYTPMLWRIARAHGLGDADAADVCQFCWLTLAGNLRAIRDPERLGGWLATTARREALRLTRARLHERAENDWENRGSPDPGPERLALLGDRDTALWAAVNGLPQRCRTLLTLIAVAPELSYPQLATAAGISPGSVGPNRCRCVHHLRRELRRTGFFDEAEVDRLAP